MKVKVRVGSKELTYLAPVGTEVGASVTVPGFWWNDYRPQRGVVTELGSDYAGPVTSVLEVS